MLGKTGDRARERGKSNEKMLEEKEKMTGKIHEKQKNRERKKQEK